MKKITILSVISIFLLSANVLFAQDEMKAKTSTVTPESFQDMAANSVGQEVEISGLVVHVCAHGGKKLFIIGENPDIRIKITASDKVSVFKPELEGSTIHVKGIIEPIAEEEAMAAESQEGDDADHTNYYHKPQFSISCMEIKTLED